MNPVVSDFNTWLISTKAELFSRRGETGKALGRRIESYGPARDCISAHRIMDNLQSLIPQDDDHLMSMKWIRRILRERDDWSTVLDDRATREDTPVIVDHLLCGSCMSELIGYV